MFDQEVSAHLIIVLSKPLLTQFRCQFLPHVTVVLLRFRVPPRGWCISFMGCPSFRLHFVEVHAGVTIAMISLNKLVPFIDEPVGDAEVGTPIPCDDRSGSGFHQTQTVVKQQLNIQSKAYGHVLPCSEILLFLWLHGAPGAAYK